MGSSVENRIASAAHSLAQELQLPVSRWFERLTDQHDLSDLPADRVEPLVRFVACSEFGARVVLQDWAWFIENVASFDEFKDLDKALLASFADSDAAVDELKSELRRFRNRTLLRILWREIFGLADLDETLGQLSGLADSMLDAATRFAMRTLEPRYGHVRDHSGKRFHCSSWEWASWAVANSTFHRTSI